MVQENVFTLNGESWLKAAKRRSMYLLALAVAIAASAIIFQTLSNSSDRQDDSALMAAGLATGLIFLLIFARVLPRMRKQQQDFADSFRLIVDGRSVVRRAYNYPTITLLYEHITEISETRKGGLVIKGQSSNDTIFVPHALNDLAEARLLLEKIRPVVPYRAEFKQTFLPVGVLIATAVSMLIGKITDNEIMMKITMLVFSIIMIIFLLVIQKNKNISSALKDKARWLLSIYLLAIITALAMLAFPGLIWPV